MELPMALKMKNELLALLELKTVGAITEAEFLENKSVLFRTPAHAPDVSTSTLSLTPVMRVRCFNIKVILAHVTVCRSRRRSLTVLHPRLFRL